MGQRTQLVEDRYVSAVPTCAHLVHSFTRVRFPTRSHLNLIRSVTTILQVLDKAMKDQTERVHRRQRSLSPSLPQLNGDTRSSDYHDLSDDDRRDLAYDFSDKHKLLQLRLQPLIRVQRDLENYLGSASLEPDRIATANGVAFPSSGAASTRRHTEFSVPVNSSWKARLLGKDGNSKRLLERKSIQDLHDATEIIYRCGSDIKQLWTDDVVQRVLKGTKTRLKHSSGL